MQLFAGELTNQNREYYKVNDNNAYFHLVYLVYTARNATDLLQVGILPIEIINNTRGGIEGKIWERGDWGANSSPGCSLIHDVRRVFLLLKLFFAVKILQISFQIV